MADRSSGDILAGNSTAFETNTNRSNKRGKKKKKKITAALAASSEVPFPDDPFDQVLGAALRNPSALTTPKAQVTKKPALPILDSENKSIASPRSIQETNTPRVEPQPKIPVPRLIASSHRIPVPNPLKEESGEDESSSSSSEEEEKQKF